LYPLYKLAFSYIEDFPFKAISGLFLFVTLLILQALIFENELSGKIGEIIVEVLSPYIGIAGLWIFVAIGLLISAYMLIEENKDNLKSLFSNINIKKPTLSLPKKQKPKKAKSTKKESEQKVVIKEIGDTAEIILEDVPVDEIPPFDVTAKEVKENSEASLIEEVVEETPAPKETHATIVEELEENKKLLEDIEIGETEKPKDFKLPPTKYFEKPPKKSKVKINEAIIDQKIEDLLEKLMQFKIEGDVVRTYTGPIVTTFEFKPAPNVKVSKILNLQDDLAMALKAQTIRIQAPIPGKDVVGIEVPNEDSEIIYIREMLESEIFQNSASPLTMILGKDIVGQPFITDLKKLPHLLIAGTTGSGKSVGINAMILSLLYKNSPDNLKFIMIDPKMLEFSIYNDIPHLLTPVITKPMEAINALANMVKEMERRYAMMADTRTKNIENYNEKAKENGNETLPYIVVIIDELADLMMTSGKEVELSIARLAQMARASGIHLIVATQRPSADVVTGLIKANLPSRLSYKVGQKVDSKIILDAMGADSLLGRGDMLFTPPGMSGLVRVHAPWSDEKEIEQVVEFLKAQKDVEYDTSFLKDNAEAALASDPRETGELDDLYEQAKLVVQQDKKSSISYLQRRLKIGYNRAASIVEQLEQTGVLSAPNAKGNREILI
jgi:S-DNA-T family DNA segregation ATPase FtsK/SpoIIIE